MDLLDLWDARTCALADVTGLTVLELRDRSESLQLPHLA